MRTSSEFEHIMFATEEESKKQFEYIPCSFASLAGFDRVHSGDVGCSWLFIAQQN